MIERFVYRRWRNFYNDCNNNKILTIMIICHFFHKHLKWDNIRQQLRCQPTGGKINKGSLNLFRMEENGGEEIKYWGTKKRLSDG